ncbi:glycosyl transferase-like protein, partial [Dinothrombium tinctorium]
HIQEPKTQIEFLHQAFENHFQAVKYSERRMRQIISEIKPDIIIQNDCYAIPALALANVPLVVMFSINPLHILHDNLPPATFGLPLNDTKDWDKCRKLWETERLKKLWKRYNQWLESMGAPSLKKYYFTYTSTHLNALIYPLALAKDYLKLCPVDDTWMCLDHALRTSKGCFEIPEKVKRRNAKMVYFSVGTISSMVIELMQRLISILAKSKHSFIVSTGKFHDAIELAENMWGDNDLPQLSILPQVDLVICHGGSNTFIETLYFGKPLILLPVFVDQHDNAQRAAEMNIAIKLNPFTVEERELLSTIDNLLENKEITNNVAIISKQIRETDSMDKFIDRLESVASDAKKPNVVSPKK